MPKKGIHDCGGYVWDEKRVWRKKPKVDRTNLGFLSIIKEKGRKFMKRLISVFLALALICIAGFSASAVACESISDTECMLIYVRDGAGSFLERGDVVFVKRGVNPKISGFNLVTDPAEIKRIVEIIGNSTNPKLIPIVSKNGGDIGCGWGKFRYNRSLNRIEDCTGGNAGAGGGGRGKGNGSGGTGGGGGE